MVLVPAIMSQTLYDHRIGIGGTLKNDTVTNDIREHQHLLDQSPDVICTLDESGCYLYVNAASRRIFGYEPGSLEGLRCLDFIHNDDKRATVNAFQKILAGSDSDLIQIDNRHLTIDGDYVQVSWSMRANPQERSIYAVGRKTTNGYTTNCTGQAIPGILRKQVGTSIQRTEEEIIYSLLQEMNSFATLDDSLLRAVRVIGKMLDMQGAEAWLVHNDAQSIRLRARWVSDQTMEGSGIYANEEMQAGEGLPGTILKQKRTIYCDDLAIEGYQFGDSPGPRWSSATGFPVLANGTVKAVIVLYQSSPIPPSLEIEQLFQKISLQIGIDIQRKQAVHHMYSFFTGSPDFLGIFSQNGRLIRVNPAFRKHLGYTDQELTSRPFVEFLHPHDIDTTEQLIDELKKGQHAGNLETRVRTHDGKWKWIVWHPSGWVDQEGLLYLYGRDITELKNTNQELLKFKNVIELSNDGISIYTLQDKKYYLNHSFVEMLGYTGNELNEIGGLFNLYNDSNLRDIIPRMLLSGNYWQGDISLTTRSGEKRNLYLSAGPVFNSKNELIAIYGIHTDISEHRQAQEKISESLREKEVLLSEIHHRVKNNLAVVSSMLQLQALQEDHEGMNTKLLESSLRVKTIASIHEHLYESDSFSKIDFSKSIARQVSGIVDTMKSSTSIRMDLNCEPVQLNVNQAITCSLIVNEVVTNIIKHAFGEKERGLITVTLTEKNNRVTLVVSDNGKGLPDHLDFRKNYERSLGLHLINVLSRQLDAAYLYDSANGSRFSLHFNKKDPKGIANADLA